MSESLVSSAQEWPLVTVAMPVYNAGKYLRLAVVSIARQTFTNWELLIIDDGSTDNALQTIADIHDERIRILRDGHNRGLAVRLNEAINIAKGRYLARMDADDVAYPERFARQIAVLQNDPELDLVATRAITIDENHEVTGLFPHASAHEEICARPWLGFYLPHPTWMGKAEWFRQHRYTVPGPYCCEDQELLMRSYTDSRFATVEEILFAYRIRGKVDWQKLARTRRTVLVAQFRQFASTGRGYLLMMSMLAFIGKTALDLLKRVRGQKFYPANGIVDRTIMSKWQTILNQLETESKSS